MSQSVEYTNGDPVSYAGIARLIGEEDFKRIIYHSCVCIHRRQPLCDGRAYARMRYKDDPGFNVAGLKLGSVGRNAQASCGYVVIGVPCSCGGLTQVVCGSVIFSARFHSRCLLIHPSDSVRRRSTGPMISLASLDSPQTARRSLRAAPQRTVRRWSDFLYVDVPQVEWACSINSSSP